jgi:hypothetical protein
MFHDSAWSELMALKHFAERAAHAAAANELQSVDGRVVQRCQVPLQLPTLVVCRRAVRGLVP